MHWKKVYIDVECTYSGDIDIEKDKNGFFRDFPNWKFYVEKKIDGKKIEYKGIIGLFVLELDSIDDDEKNDGYEKKYKIVRENLVQLIGDDCTKENLMEHIKGLNEVVGYHCRTKPDWRGFIGFDFGVIAANLGIVLDELPGVECTDLELYCHKAKLYGGLKAIEKSIPTIPPRKSGIESGSEEDKLLHDIALCEDEEKKKQMWKRAKLYNTEDVINMLYVENYLRKIKIIEAC